MRGFDGPQQAIAIAQWLADQFPERTATDEEIEQSLYLMQKIKPVKTRQGIVHVYKYYRPRYIKCGGMTEI
jgi:hypothetical protein